MKITTKLLSLALVFVLLMSLASCADISTAGGDNPGKESEAETTAQDTTVPVTIEDTTEPESKLAINEDLISDVGLTFPQLVEKHGDRIMDKLDYHEGVLGISFENGYGAYFWGMGGFGENESSFLEATDESGYIDPQKLPDPRDDLACIYIMKIPSESLLPNAEFPMNTDEISAIDGVEEGSLKKDQVFNGGTNGWPTEYCTSFEYENIFVDIYHNEKGVIEEDSEVRMYLISEN